MRVSCASLPWRRPNPFLPPKPASLLKDGVFVTAPLASRFTLHELNTSLSRSTAWELISMTCGYAEPH